ncbi:MAG: hypothetical protein LUG46_07080 [Erysipelotrichaceae bacterium]|nr:hypothetical protein [Erysipelotrichaceae bacterium]
MFINDTVFLTNARDDDSLMYFYHEGILEGIDQIIRKFNYDYNCCHIFNFIDTASYEKIYK